MKLTYNDIFTKELLEEEYSEFKSLRAIAKRYDVDPGTIKYYMEKHELLQVQCNSL